VKYNQATWGDYSETAWAAHQERCVETRLSYHAQDLNGPDLILKRRCGRYEDDGDQERVALNAN